MSDPFVSYDHGTARGVWRDTGPGGPFDRSAAFLGLPFAEPPVGPHRFGPPVPAGAWAGVRDATAYGPTHCAELPFAWDLLDAPQVAASCDPDPPQPLADLMHRGWVSFIHDHRAPWPVWGADRSAAIFDRESSIEAAFALEVDIARTLRDH